VLLVVRKILHNKTLERDQAYCAAFRKSLVQDNLTFYRKFWGLKSLAPQLPVNQDAGCGVDNRPIIYYR